MAHEAAHIQKQFVLPALITAPGDISRLLRELESIDEALTQAAIRHADDALKTTKPSRLLDELTQVNSINLLQATARKQLINYLAAVRQTAPVIHLSFATDPSSAFLGKIVTWLRQNIHPLLLVQVGLQPNIAAGCIIRTTNKQFDFSLRKNFAENRPLLLQKIKEATTKTA